MAETAEKTKKKIKGMLSGVVTSTGAQKTIHVLIENLVKHPRYGKFVRHHKKVAVHDENEAAAKGDLVEIVPSRRLSKTKTWRLLRIVRHEVVE